MLCPYCKTDFDTRFCPNCGYSPETAEVIPPPRAPEPPPISNVQPQGGYQPPPIIINNNIGSEYLPYRPGYSPKKRWTTFFLCLFLGWIGIHRFYTGKVGTGILYLFSYGFLGIGIIIDLIMILTGSFTDKHGNFLT